MWTDRENFTYSDILIIWCGEWGPVKDLLHNETALGIGEEGLLVVKVNVKTVKSQHKLSNAFGPMDICSISLRCILKINTHFLR